MKVGQSIVDALKFYSEGKGRDGGRQRSQGVREGSFQTRKLRDLSAGGELRMAWTAGRWASTVDAQGAHGEGSQHWVSNARLSRGLRERPSGGHSPSSREGVMDYVRLFGGRRRKWFL